MPLLSTFGAAASRAFASRRAGTVIQEGFDVYFPGGAITATMGITDSIVVTADYDVPGQEIDSISFQVAFNGGSTTQWAQVDFSSSATVLEAQTFNSSDAGWSFWGTYTFFCAGRRTGGSVYDVISNSITLTVA
jgi:hypothetical protein